MQIYLLQQQSAVGDMQLPLQSAGDYAFLTSDFINIDGQTIQLQLPSGLQLPISMLTTSQLLANGIQLLDMADVQQAQTLLTGSSEVRQDELATDTDLLPTSQQDARDDVVNPATVLLQLASENASARANRVIQFLCKFVLVLVCTAESCASCCINYLATTLTLN